MKKKSHELKKIVIIGAGGQGKDILWTITDMNKASNVFDVVGFLDDDKKLHGIGGVIGGTDSGCSLNTTNVFLEVLSKLKSEFS